MARSGGDALRIQERPILFDGQTFCAKNELNQNRSLRPAKLEKYISTSWVSEIPSCMVFTPTADEFKDPLAFISSISPEASKYGICKIIPPVLPSVSAGRVLMKELAGFKFTTRVQPMRLSSWDSNDKVTFVMSGQRYTFKEFEKVANKFYAHRFSSAAHQPAPFVEAEFWKEMMSGKGPNVEYASDIDGSAFSKNSDDPLASSKWNLKEISDLPQSTLRLLDTVIPGVTEPMLYIGMLFSMFAWHVEDHYLYSINYHHCGASKTWYGVPGNASDQFEKVVKEDVYDTDLVKEHGNQIAYDLLIGKTTMFPPSLLRDRGVPVYRAVQAPGEFVITFPRAYHAGFSHGFNCGEAVNFAMADWFPLGAAACRRYSLLNRMPLLPHEQLLCQEAAFLDKREISSLERFTKLSFLKLMSFQHKVRWLLKQKGASLCLSSDAPTNVTCSLCKHLCYISFITCDCYAEPTCLNHADAIRKCKCGSARRVILNSDVVKMDTLAQKYYKLKEEEVKEEAMCFVQDGMGPDVEELEEDMFHSEDYVSYVPFEDIGVSYKLLEKGFPVFKQTCQGSSTVGSSQVAEDDNCCHAETKVNIVLKNPPLSAVSNKVKPGLAVRTMPGKKPHGSCRRGRPSSNPSSKFDAHQLTTNSSICMRNEEKIISMKQEVLPLLKSSCSEDEGRLSPRGSCNELEERLLRKRNAYEAATDLEYANNNRCQRKQLHSISLSCSAVVDDDDDGAVKRQRTNMDASTEIAAEKRRALHGCFKVREKERNVGEGKESVVEEEDKRRVHNVCRLKVKGPSRPDQYYETKGSSSSSNRSRKGDEGSGENIVAKDGIEIPFLSYSRTKAKQISCRNDRDR